MRKNIFVLFLSLLFSLYQNKIFAGDVKDTIQMGIFIESLYDLDFAGYYYSANFWMWSVAKGDLNDDGKIDGADSLALQKPKSERLDGAFPSLVPESPKGVQSNLYGQPRHILLSEEAAPFGHERMPSR